MLDSVPDFVEFVMLFNALIEPSIMSHSHVPFLVILSN
jgi:hypothetical protein